MVDNKNCDGFFDDKIISKCSTTKNFQLYLKSKSETLQHYVEISKDKEFNIKLKDGRISLIKHEIQENILQKKCPSCSLVFYANDACRAITCECGVNFCGFCLKKFDSSSITHDHVRKCEYNPEKGYLFVSDDKFEEAHFERWKILLTDYFITLKNQCSDEIYQKLKSDDYIKQILLEYGLNEL